MEDISKLANYINMKDIPTSWNIGIKKIKEKIPKQIDWLNMKNSQEILDFYELKEENFRERYIETIKAINNDEKLKMIVYLWHYILYIDNTNLCDDIWNWKTTEDLYKEHGNYMLAVVAMLSGYTIHKQIMKEKGFSEKQIEYHKYNIKKTCGNDNKNYNLNGIRFSQMIWGSYFMKGKIIQVGRLQYEIDLTIPDDLKVYINKDTNYIYIHIPEEEKLLEEDVEASLIQCKKYILKYFPELKTNKFGFYTKTWLLSDELDSILNSDSNIMKFKKRFKIVKQEKCNQDFLEFIFKEGLDRTINYNELREDTYLQKKIKEHLINGVELHIGLGILK